MSREGVVVHGEHHFQSAWWRPRPWYWELTLTFTNMGNRTHDHMGDRLRIKHITICSLPNDHWFVYGLLRKMRHTAEVKKYWLTQNNVWQFIRLFVVGTHVIYAHVFHRFFQCKQACTISPLLREVHQVLHFNVPRSFAVISRQVKIEKMAWSMRSTEHTPPGCLLPQRQRH